ncbi:cryptococcal mannosyltransferase 1-domain-containing protein [Xylogone sp. PMI_703]|nr:cryptococcal mannosyltransferase 1-domain-containing protein [Xylogone sp. PMI_703]
MRDYEPLPRSSVDTDFDEEVALKELRYLQRPRRHCCFSISTLIRKGRRVFRPLYLLITLILFLFVQVTFNASYVSPPPFDIPSNETVYIAANIVNGDLISGAWGKSLAGLVDLIGKDRVFVSIYGGPKSALLELEDMLDCEYSIVPEEDYPIEVDHLPRITLPTTSEQKIKRIAYLASVRNRALAPLDALNRRFDKLLFLNDVIFSPQDATRLLWGTNVIDGKAEYRSVCATDFATSWKYYDTFATRDLQGYSIGLPIFPWFANEGSAQSRNDVLAEKDAVRVKSCWGGMVAFDARYFQPEDPSAKAVLAPPRSVPRLQEKNHYWDQYEEPAKLPLRFRAEPDPFYDSSECCLIHADISSLPEFTSSRPSSSRDLGIFMNPYVRVTYDSQTHSYLWIAKRFERLFALPQAIINKIVHLPVYNARRTEEAGDVISDRIWIPYNTSNPSKEFSSERGAPDLTPEDWNNLGRYENVQRISRRGGFCAVRQLLVYKPGPLEEGERNWENLRREMPPLENQLKDQR